MGYGMVANLLKENLEVLAYDTDEEKIDAVVVLGATKVYDVSEISNTVETIILCLPHPDISQEVISTLLEPKNNRIKTIIDTSTLTPDVTKKIYDNLVSQNINFLCAPMLGGKNAALNKQIHFLVEGDESVFADNKSLFLSMGSKADYFGEAPCATIAKLAYNICRYSNLATATEVSRFLRSHTQNTEPIYNLLAEGSLDNFGQVWGEDVKDMVVNGNDYVPSRVPEKDLSLIIEISEKKKLSNNLLLAIRDVYRSFLK